MMMKRIKYKKLDLIITGSPKPDNINEFINIARQNKIADVVRTCDLDYDEKLVKPICYVHEYVFDDGKFPTSDIISKWVDLLFVYFYEYRSIYLGHPILVHCQDGKGRAPILVCIAIIICENKSPNDAICIVRKHVPTAFNKYQIEMLDKTDWETYRVEFRRFCRKYNPSRKCLIC
jgi:hypothetical protein